MQSDYFSLDIVLFPVQLCKKCNLDAEVCSRVTRTPVSRVSFLIGSKSLKKASYTVELVKIVNRLLSRLYAKLASCYRFSSIVEEAACKKIDATTLQSLSSNYAKFQGKRNKNCNKNANQEIIQKNIYIYIKCKKKTLRQMYSRHAQTWCVPNTRCMYKKYFTWQW